MSAEVMATGYDSTCGTCPFWNRAPSDERPIPQGECRADPPKVFLFPVMQPASQKVMLDQIQAQQAQMGIIGQTAFPTTSADQWCGAHPARELPAGDDS